MNHVHVAQCSGCGRQKCRLKVIKEKDAVWFACAFCDSEFRKHLESIDAQYEIERLEDRIKELKTKDE